MMQLRGSAHSQLEAGLSNLKHVQLINSFAHCIKLKVHDMCTLLTIPAWYFENNNSENRGLEKNEEGEEVFMLTLSSEDDLEDRDWLPIFLQSTNERLERIRNGSEVVKFVVEGILKALSTVVQIDTDEENIDGEKAEDDDDGADEREEDDYWYDDTSTVIETQSEQVLGIRKSSKLYLMAQAAAKTCRNRFLISGPSDSGNQQWCSVHPNPVTCAVRLQIEVAGLVDNVEAPISLGIPVAGSCLEIKLQFSSDQWCSKLLREDLDTSECSVGACSVKGLSKEAGDEEGPRVASWKSYGLSCFVPELVTRFLMQWGSRNKSVSGQERVASTRDSEPEEEQANLFLDLLNHICVKLKTLCEFCPICFTSLPCEVGRLRPCNKDLCLYKFEELGSLTSILSELEAPQIVELELSMALSAARATADVFEPFPGYLLGHREARGRNGWFTETRERSRMEWSTTNKDVLRLQMALNAVPELARLQKCKDEAELKETMAVHWAEQKEKPPMVAPEDVSLQENLPYNLLHFVLSTNRCSMLNLEQEEWLDIGVNATAQIMIINDSPEREAEFNNKRDVRGSFYAFHGSVGSNWYSILRNGLRSMSSTKYMAVGAALGPGIYLASHIGTSASYSRTSGAAFGWSHSPYRGGLHCIAIVEAINGCLTHAGASAGRGILVVKPEEERSVMIRYLLVFNYTPVFATNIGCSGKVMHGIPDKSIDLSKHFNDVKGRWEARRAAEKEVRKTHCHGALHRKVALEAQVEQERERAFSHKREPPILRRPASTHSLPGNMQAIQKEYAKLMRLQHQGNDAFPSGCLSLTLPEVNSLLTWRVHFMPLLFQGSPLGHDLAEAASLRGLQTLPLTLEITFPFHYPFSPPFLRVVSPHFMFHTGHITLGGSICMELLTASGWLPTYSIESVLVSILAEMHGGEARLDRQRMSNPGEYSRAEAKESFERAAVTHGWTT